MLPPPDSSKFNPISTSKCEAGKQSYSEFPAQNIGGDSLNTWFAAYAEQFRTVRNTFSLQLNYSGVVTNNLEFLVTMGTQVGSGNFEGSGTLVLPPDKDSNQYQGRKLIQIRGVDFLWYGIYFRYANTPTTPSGAPVQLVVVTTDLQVDYQVIFGKNVIPGAV